MKQFFNKKLDVKGSAIIYGCTGCSFGCLGGCEKICSDNCKTGCNTGCYQYCKGGIKFDVALPY